MTAISRTKTLNPKNRLEIGTPRATRETITKAVENPDTGGHVIFTNKPVIQQGKPFPSEAISMADSVKSALLTKLQNGMAQLRIRVRGGNDDDDHNPVGAGPRGGGIAGPTANGESD